MHGTKIAASNGPSSKLVINAKPRHNIVRHNRLAFTFSLIIMFNLASMPMKSYFTEKLPWTFDFQNDRINITNITTLQAYQIRYNQDFVPRGVNYYFDSFVDVQVLHRVLCMKERIDVYQTFCLNYLFWFSNTFEFE
ncbi:hypothetical protein THRCLA_21408 [Thraustotheca clavata]|uniref:Uncharacterized protein n=1 Tax=Thraustotheca clavata TaxID=74557 RepID=A0A1V9ZWU0_9STRA|nr:hypothetical protein THRCLA_21408 [Thraustotheca clavata]